MRAGPERAIFTANESTGDVGSVTAVEALVLAEQVRLLYARAPVAQATVVINACIISIVFWSRASHALSIAWAGALCVLAALRIALVMAYRSRGTDRADPSAWARRFTVGTILTGIVWGAAVPIFYAPGSPLHQVFLAFVLGGMTAGAAASNASYTPTFVAFAAPALVPMVITLGAQRDLIHVSMAFMLAMFGVAVSVISRCGSRTVRQAIRLRFQNETLVDGLAAARRHLEGVNADLERHVRERTHELERQLELRGASEARLAVTLDSIGDAVVTTDRAGNASMLNRVAEALTGWKAEEAAGRRLHDILQVVDDGVASRGEDLVDVVLTRMAVVSSGARTLIGRDGTRRPIAYTAAPIRNPHGHVLGIVLVFRDRTNERRAEELLRLSNDALRESDRRKNQFIAVLSHELRNPLGPIRNSLYLLDHAAPGSEKASLARQILERQTDHLARLVDDLLDVTRISRGKIDLRRARVDVCEVTRRACEDHRALLRGRGQDLRVEITGPLWIDADEARLTQIIGNLLQNAAKFGRRDGTVTVHVREAEGRAEILVHDDGIGLPAELLPRLFEPFVQAEGDLARSHGGLGLGLALAKGLVELHGGTVVARSEGPGRGSDFVVTLPLASAGEPSAVASPNAQATRSREILLIEDNVDAACSMATVLELEGHRVHVAHDGQSGISLAHELNPELILCDIGLPDLDGYEVARALRRDERISARLIAVSGYAQPEDVRRAEEAGFDAHIAKPPSIHALMDLIRK